MSVQHLVSPAPPRSEPAGLASRARSTTSFPIAFSLVRSGARGLAIGALAVTMVCAAFAAENLHTGHKVADWALGIILIGVPLVLLFVVLRVATSALAWIVGRLARHASDSSRGQIGVLIATLHFLGRFLFATTLGTALMVWASPTEGVFALFHSLFFFEIPILAGAIVGLLIGVSLAATRVGPSPRRFRVLAVATVVPALFLGAGTGLWALSPGMGDPIVRDAPAAVDTIAAIDLPDPSQQGPFSVVAATYGSGLDSRRSEYGADVDWRTPTVDASVALGDRGGIAEPYARWFWGFDTAHLPLNALIWYPADAPGPLPVALIVHGNHSAGDYSDTGYTYLGEHLASRGIIAASIDENFLNGDAFFDYGGSEMGTRAWLLLGHLDQLREWDSAPGHPLANRVDLDRVALIGHSRGGEAAAVAAMLEADPAISLPGLPAIPRGFTVRAVIAFAPSDTNYTGPGRPTTLSDVDYLTIQGAHDGDLSGFEGIKTYHRVKLSGKGDHLKVAVYSERANHGRFNSVWDYGDAGPLDSWMLDRGSMLSAADQERLAKTLVSAFISRSLLGQTSYDAFFREPRAGRAWLPDDVVQTHWQSSGRVIVDDFGPGRAKPERNRSEGFTRVTDGDPPLRGGGSQVDRAALLSWSNDASYTLPVERAIATRIDPDGSLVLALAASSEGLAPVDPLIELRSADGRVAAVRLGEVAPARPQLPTQLWKLPALGERYASEEKHLMAAERFLQTYEVRLSAFRAATPGFDPSAVVAVSVRFEGAGAVYLDDVAFEPAVAN